MAEASEAAQRIVSLPQEPPETPVAPLPSMQPFAVPVAKPTLTPSSASSFDFLPTPRPQAVSTPVSVTQPQPVPPVEARPTVGSAPLLPTDLSPSLLDNAHEQTVSKKKLNLPNIGGHRVIMAMAVVVFMAGVGVAFLGLRTNHDITAQVKGISNSRSANQDDEGGLSTDGIPTEDGNPPSVQYYRTAASYPRVIRIAKTNTEARILPLGIAVSGALKAPGNIFDAGWYKDSAKPGEEGAMVIDGHVSGPTKPGIFKKLGTMAKGDKIEIERGDGQTFSYTVKDVKVFDADKLDMSSVMVPYVPGKQGLNIITCGGKFNPETQKYEQRTVVYAVL